MAHKRPEPGGGESFENVRERETQQLQFVGVTAEGSTEAVALDTRLGQHPPVDETHKGAFRGPVGLALSGGGIRSATFNLGVLQALAAHGLLPCFHYLSTVSGGGYIGAWLSAWIYRRRHALLKRLRREGRPISQDVQNKIARHARTWVERRLARSACRSQREPDPVQWLRRYSNYLTPRVGMLSTDALTVAAIWLRNVFLNSLILVLLTSVLLLLPILAIRAVEWMIEIPPPGTPPEEWRWNVVVPMSIGLLLGALALGQISTHLTLSSHDAIARHKASLSTRRVLFAIVMTAFVAAVFGSIWLIGSDFQDPGVLISVFHLFGWRPTTVKHYAIMHGLTAVCVVGATWLLFWIPALVKRRNSGRTRPTKQDIFVYIVALLVSMAIAVLVLSYWVSLWNVYERELRPWQLARASVTAPILAFGAPLMLFVFALVGSIWVGLVGRSYREASREWWARMNGWHTFVGLVWQSFCSRITSRHCLPTLRTTAG